MEPESKIKLQLSSFDQALETTGFLMVLILWGFTLFAYFNLPATIPTHFDALGNVNNYGSKATILFMAAFATLVFFGVTVLNKHPGIFNYARPVNKENTEQQYKYATRMLRFLKLTIVIVFILIILLTYLTTNYGIKEPGIWFVLLIAGLINIPTVYYIIRSIRAK